MQKRYRVGDQVCIENLAVCMSKEDVYQYLKNSFRYYYSKDCKVRWRQNGDVLYIGKVDLLSEVSVFFSEVLVMGEL
jgi:hypothetical protein